MDLNLTNLRDLEQICQIAENYFEKEYGLPVETQWIRRIAKYRKMLLAEIERLETKGSKATEPLLSVTLSTCRATEQQATKFKLLSVQLGFVHPTDFWRRSLKTLIAQIESGQKLKWPLEFVHELGSDRSK